MNAPRTARCPVCGAIGFQSALTPVPRGDGLTGYCWSFHCSNDHDGAGELRFAVSMLPAEPLERIGTVVDRVITWTCPAEHVRIVGRNEDELQEMVRHHFEVTAHEGVSLNGFALGMPVLEHGGRRSA